MSEEPNVVQPLVPVDRILVALDTSPQSLNALDTAAELASILDAELHGLFIEDDNLLRLCNLPFVREIGSYSASSRPLDGRSVEREFRQQAVTIRRTIAQTAVNANVRWSFEVTRGKVSEELLAATEAASLVTMGRVGRSLSKRYGSTAQSLVRRSMRPVFLLGDGGLSYPLTVIYSGTPASMRALRLSILLMQHREDELRILFLAESGLTEEERARLSESVGVHGVLVQHKVLDPGDSLLNAVRSDETGLLVVPADQADILESLARSAIVTP